MKGWNTDPVTKEQNNAKKTPENADCLQTRACAGPRPWADDGQMAHSFKIGIISGEGRRSPEELNRWPKEIVMMNNRASKNIFLYGWKAGVTVN